MPVLAMSKRVSISPPPSRLLRAADAASYCGVGLDTFLKTCPVQRRRIHPGDKGLRWDVHLLDEWIDNLPLHGTPATVTPEQYLEALDGDNKDRGRKVVHE
jgi:hypothetical protein